MKKHSEIFGWGNNSYGQLGISETSEPFERIPRVYTFQIQISAVACGESHSLCLSSTGHLYSFGSNQDGRLGINDSSLSYSSSPCLIKSLPTINKIVCGSSHSMALSSSGEVFTWGLGRFGNLGTGSTNSCFSPVKISFPSQFSCIQISAGSRHSAAILTDGQKATLFTCGEGSHGQLGTGKFSNENCFVKVKENVLSVACGYEHTALISANYELFVTGSNSEGQLALDSQPCLYSFCKVQCEEIVKVSCSNLTVCVTSTGKLLVAGSHFSGLRSVDNAQVITEVTSGYGYFLAIDCNRKVFLWEAGKFKQYRKLSNKNIEKISAGKDFFLAIGSSQTDNRRVRNLSMTFENKGLTSRKSGTARLNNEEWNTSTNDWSRIFEEEKIETKKYVEMLQKELESYKSELRALKQNKENENQKLGSELLRIEQENIELKQRLLKYTKENQEILAKNSKLEAELKSNYSIRVDALYHLDKTQAENDELRIKVASLMKANSDLTKQIEEDISTQVRSYKEKTIDLLSMPISPRVESKILNQTTPKKENLKAKLLALQNNRAQLEANLKSLI